jgi:hypothetical protein
MNERFEMKNGFVIPSDQGYHRHHTSLLSQDKLKPTLSPIVSLLPANTAAFMHTSFFGWTLA